MADRVEIGIPLPPDPSRVVEHARFAEDAGLDSVWQGDHLLSAAPDSMLTLATAAAATTRLRIGVNVLVLPLRPIVLVAKQIASLQQLSGNRLLLGVGTGLTHHGWPAVGVDHRRRGELIDAALRLLPALVAGEAVEVNGELVRIEPGVPMPRLLVGGGRVGARRAAQFGGDWLPTLANPAEILAFRPRLRQLAERFGRPTPSITLTVGLALGHVATEDFERQLQIVMAHGLSEQDARAAILTGGTDEAAGAVAEWAVAGVTRVVAVPFAGDWRHQVTQLGRLAEHVHTTGVPG
jgi:alkanesulfonate monooxygenase SsuD/methylene tetrahydromethanopterin reductase-like flavin-dependent oxidoreductase (luciferase family)